MRCLTASPAAWRRSGGALCARVETQVGAASPADTAEAAQMIIQTLRRVLSAPAHLQTLVCVLSLSYERARLLCSTETEQSRCTTEQSRDPCTASNLHQMAAPARCRRRSAHRHWHPALLAAPAAQSCVSQAIRDANGSVQSHLAARQNRLPQRATLQAVHGPGRRHQNDVKQCRSRQRTRAQPAADSSAAAAAGRAAAGAAAVPHPV